MDALRGIASLLVVWAHAWQWSGHPFAGRWISTLQWARLGVELFFVLSGFLITGILLDHVDHPAYARNFYARRALRILPLFYAVLALDLVLARATGRRMEGYEIAAFVLYGANLLMAVRGFRYLPPLNVMWSLAIEEQFYLVWPWIVRRLRAERLPRLVAAAIVAGAVLRAAATAAGLPHHWSYNFTLTRLDGLLLGAGLAVWLRSGAEAGFVRSASRAALAASGGLYALDLLVFGRSLRWLGLDRTLEAAVCASVLLAALAHHDAPCVRRGLANGVLRFFGEISYGMYLYHLLVVMAYTRGFERLHPEVPFAVQWAGLLAGASAVSFASWRLFEEPILRWKARFEYGGGTAPREPAPGAAIRTGA